MLAVKQVVSGSDYLDVLSWWVGIDPEDNQRKVFVRFRNSRNVDIAVQLQCTVLYVKNEDTGTSISIESFSMSQPGTLSPGQSATCKGMKLKDGYTPKGLLSIEQTPTGSTYLDILSWWVGIDPEDDQRKIFAKIRNSSDVDITYTMKWTVLYIRD